MHACIADDAPRCRTSFVIDEGGLDELARRGESVGDAVLDRRIARLTTDQLATIVYTSGTTGRPKGCAITHGNLRTNVLQNLDAVRSMLEPEEVSLVFLPLAHTLAEDHRPRRHGMGHHDGVRDRYRAPPRRDWRWYGRRCSSRYPGCSRRSSTLRSTGRTPKGTAASSTSRSKSPSAGPRTTRPERITRSSRSNTPRWNGRCTASCRRYSAAECASLSAAAALSVNGSRTSSTASESRSSRATASPRRARP